MSTTNLHDADNPQVTIAGTGATEGGNGAFTVTRTGSTSGSLTVNYTVTGGSATSGSDFTALSGSVTIASGKSSADVTVAALADNLVEGSETVQVTVTDGGSAYSAYGTSASASPTIADCPPTVFMTPVNVYEDGNPGSVMFLRTGGDIASPLSVDYTVAGTATAGTDYTTLSGTVEFEAGSSVAFVEIEPDADMDDEGDETVTFTIEPGVSYIVVAQGVTSAVASITIIDDDAPGDISGTAWLDVDADGVFDGGEDAAEGVTVELLDDNGAPVLDGNDDPIQTATDVDGEYAFEDVDPGSYQLRFTAVSGTVLNGASDTWTATLSVDSFQPAIIDLPVYDDAQTGSISGFVWDDLDGDGYRSGYETVLESVDVVVRDFEDTIVDTTATDSDGFYEVTALAPGTYSVEFTVSGDYLMAASADPVWETSVATPGPATTLDAPAYLLSQIDGTVWVDTDRDGVVDGGESKLAGVTVSLLDTGGDPVLDGNSDPIQAVTDAYGAYTLADLVPGNYQLEYVAPSGYVLDGDSDTLTIDAGAFSGQINTIDRPAYSDSATTSIEGVVWVDTNGNGTQDVGESGLADVDVVIKDGNDDVVGTDTTDGSGAFSVGSLDPGTYTVEFTAPNGYSMMATAQSTSNATVSTPGSSTTVSVGAYEPADVTGTVWVDEDADGVKDGGEDRLENVLVVATDSAGHVAFAATTNANGEYTMPGLRPGDYQITFTAPSGYVLNGTATTVTVSGTLASGDSPVIDRPAYDDEQLGTISGSIWEDDDLDGVKDGGESFLSGVLVELLDSDGDPVLDGKSNPIQVTTSGSGLFSFTDLDAGLYSVRFTAPSGYVMESSHDLVTTRTIITPGTHTTANEGAFQPENRVSGSVWLDEADWDGVWGGGESGLAGVSVALTDLGGGTVLDLNSDPVSPVTTDAYGAFTFPEVAPGDYLVKMTAPSGYALEDSWIITWEGRFTVGADSPLKVGGYVQQNPGNAPAAIAPPPASRVGAWRVENLLTITPTPADYQAELIGQYHKWSEIPRTSQSVVIGGLSPEKLAAIAPKGVTFPAGWTSIIVEIPKGTALQQGELEKLRDEVFKELDIRYNALLKKHNVFV